DTGLPCASYSAMPATSGPKNQSLDSPNIAAKLTACLLPAVNVMSNASPGESAPVVPVVFVACRADLSTLHGAMFSIRSLKAVGVGAGGVGILSLSAHAPAPASSAAIVESLIIGNPS